MRWWPRNYEPCRARSMLFFVKNYLRFDFSLVRLERLAVNEMKLNTIQMESPVKTFDGTLIKTWHIRFYALWVCRAIANNMYGRIEFNWRFSFQFFSFFHFVIHFWITPSVAANDLNHATIKCSAGAQARNTSTWGWRPTTDIIKRSSANRTIKALKGLNDGRRIRWSDILAKPIQLSHQWANTTWRKEENDIELRRGSARETMDRNEVNKIEKPERVGKMIDCKIIGRNVKKKKIKKNRFTYLLQVGA